jgi:antitoxin (DNA-binding transcriptional repressor) of toxin-antitoxin stability system
MIECHSRGCVRRPFSRQEGQNGRSARYRVETPELSSRRQCQEVIMGGMASVHMSEAEVARDLHAVLAKVQQGVEIVIEQDHRPVAVLRPSQSGTPGRKLSECIALATAYEEKLCYAPIPDADFARDVQAGRLAPRPVRTVWMGLVLDSSVLIAAEREKRSVSRLLSSLEASCLETQFLLSSITVMELEHGWHRANTPEAASNRRRFIDEVTIGKFAFPSATDVQCGDRRRLDPSMLFRQCALFREPIGQHCGTKQKSPRPVPGALACAARLLLTG